MKYKNTLYPYFFGIFMLKKIFIWENNTYFNNYIWYFINLKRVIFHFFIKKFENIFWFNNYFIPLNHIFIFIYLFVSMFWWFDCQQFNNLKEYWVIISLMLNSMLISKIPWKAERKHKSQTNPNHPLCLFKKLQLLTNEKLLGMFGNYFGGCFSAFEEKNKIK